MRNEHIVSHRYIAIQYRNNFRLVIFRAQIDHSSVVM